MDRDLHISKAKFNSGDIPIYAGKWTANALFDVQVRGISMELAPRDLILRAYQIQMSYRLLLIHDAITLSIRRARGCGL
jgi:hypothetical protein